jgi:TetR/AcrR family transcriptional regulator, transcriptional repressor for nem operon
MKDTRTHILEVSVKLFLQKSFKDVTMKEIVAATGLSKGAFYHYFESKEQLFIEIIEVFFFSKAESTYKDIKFDSLAGFIKQYCERIKSFIDWFNSEFGGSNPELQMNYYMLMFEGLQRYPGFMERITEMHRVEREVWIKMVHDARENGEIKSKMTDEQIAQLILYSGDGIGMHTTLESNMVFMVNKVDELWNAFYEQIKA